MLKKKKKSKNPMVALQKNTHLKTALKAAGFYGITINAEVYEQDTGYYHVPVEIKYMEV